MSDANTVRAERNTYCPELNADLDRPRGAATNRALQAALVEYWYPWLIVACRDRIDYIKAEGLSVGYEPEDLAQETVILALRRIHTYQPDRYTFRLWLWYQARIMCNRIHARQLRRVRGGVDRPEQLPTDNKGRITDALPSPNAPDPADTAERNDFWGWVMVILDDERKARILAMSCRGLSFDEIGATEKCSRFTARFHIYSAYAQIQLATGQEPTKATRRGAAFNRRKECALSG
jgi:RNA polymerase sigma factor (sigma-70 family)